MKRDEKADKMGAGMRLVWLLIHLEAVTCQLLSIDDTIQLVIKQQTKYLPQPQNYSQRIDLFVPQNDYTDSELDNLNYIYHVIIVPPTEPLRWQAQSASAEYRAGPSTASAEAEYGDRFLETRYSRIHFSLLCSEGIPLLREDDQPKKCDPNSRRAEDSCPTNFWCHMGNSLETNFCCPSNRKIPNLCHLPPNSGYGNDKLTRYWHDWRAGFCREMIYSGFGGNQNCFLTRNQCEKRCAGTPKPTEAIKKVIVEQKKTKPEPLVTTTRTPPATFPPKTRFVATTAALATEKDKQMPKPVNPCSFPPDKGQKTARKPSTRWFFDLATERCIHFEFQGAGGNANNFHDEHSCVETCGGGPRGLSSCQFPLEVGIGGHAIPRYYYNSQTKSCRKFVYRGSGGNPNRFVTRSACGDTCIKGVSSAKPKLTFSSLKTATTTNSSESAHSSSSSSGSHNDTSNPLPETTKMIKTILEDLDKFTLSPDPFAPPPGASTTTASPLTTSTDTVAAKKVAQVFEKLSETESESSVDPFEMQTATPLYPQFPLTRPPADDSFEEDGEDTDVSDGPVVFPGFPPTTTAYPVDYPTLVSVTQDKKETSNEGFRQGVLSPFQAHFAKHVGVTVSPDSVQPQLPYGVTAKLTPQSPNLSNVFHLTQNGHMAPPGSTSPCSFASADTTSTMVRGCHPGGASTSGFSTWSQECPPSSFCQVGETTHLSFCCPRLGGSPCLQPRTPGVGGAQLRRWHFDVASRQCKGFIFHGFQGNENNYLSHESCRQACQASNPCPYGEPYGFESVASGQPCSTTAPSCPIHFYCHVQSPESPSAVCCPLFNGTLTGTPQIVDLSASSSGGTESSGPSIAHAHGASHSYPQPFGGPSTAPDTAGSHGSPLVGDSMGRRRGFNPFTSSAAAASFAFPCTMPIARGTGSAQLHRWGYSPSAKACITFVFSGAGGNNNNFLTKSDCIHACMATLNPCGGPVHALDGTRYQRCTTSHTCPIGQYCHLGSTEEANVCCPSSLVNPCLLSLSVGLGSASLHRYYFDGVTSTCKPFSYTGVAGNENNFRTIQDCRRACPEYDNPCQKGTPAVNPADGSVYFCSTSNQKCPRGHFCHIGDTRQTSVCCKNVGNQCSSYVLLGSGTAQLPRYYYNQKTRTCVPFAYSGKGGNSNNFVSKIECETACPVVDNPCATGFPALDTYGEPVLCSTAEPDICSKHGNYWCHISSTQSATVCCPGKTDPCKLPMSRGTGTAVLNRWYFNAESKVCVSFVYSGREGNQNNYMSRSQCIEACPEFLSPCPVGQPHIGLSGQITHCGAAEPSICPTTYWCHIGSTLDNSVCCPHSSDPCEQHKEVGTGSSQLLRYHYNQLARTCTQFRYSGLGGNENNFLTKQACEARCPVFSSPCAAGAPQMDENLTPMACSAADGTSCAPGFWCHVGSNEQSTICCSGSAENVCEEPLVIGNGDASLPRHYFNGLTKQCLPFVYSGRSGNQNNFLSKAACEESCETMRNPCAGGDPATGANGMYITCSTSSPNVCPSSFFCHHGIDLSESVCCPGGEQDPCALPVEVGEGDHSLTRFYFDPNLRRCTKFNYSSIGGNSNNFLTLQDCQLKCPEFQSPCSTGEPAQAPGGGILFCSQSRQTCPSSYWCHIGDPAEETTVCCPGKNDPCLLPMLPGSSGSKLTRFYFNQNTRQCLQFTYTGSGGNSNNFLSEADCASKCPVFRNPCPNAASNNQMAVTHCSAQNPQTCRSGHWCHLGVTSETTVCCAGASDPCRLRPSQGIIDLNGGPVTRWHYDLSSRKCKAFQYGGTAGNENNFLTREDCAQRCTEFVNTCFTGEPLMDPSTGTVRLCNAAGSVECPRNYFCLIGSSAQSSVCCPLEGRDPCTQALAVGTGALTLPRWYFNYQTKQCQEFVYSGVSGNANNFISRAACAHQCPEFVRAPPTADRRWEVASSNNPCLLPASSGSGRYSLVRFYYNPNTRQCEDFIYSGAGGNGNNFVSLQACRQTCQEASFGGNSMNPFLPPAVASAIRSPFGSRMGSHRGNDDGVPQMGRPLCPQGEPLTAPDGSPVVCSIHEANSCQKHDYRCTMTSSGQSYCCLDSRYFCLQPRQTISCPYRQQLMQVKYGYDPRTDTCQPVNGCGGSVNNFGSYVECSQSCCNKGYNLLVKFNDADFMHSNAMTEDDVDSSDKKPDMDKQFDEASDSEATTTARHRLEIDGHFHVDDDDEIYEEESRPTLPRILRIW